MLQVYLKDKEYQRKFLDFLNNSTKHKNNVVFLLEKEQIKEKHLLLTDFEEVYKDRKENSFLLVENANGNYVNNVIDKYTNSFKEILNKILPSSDFEIIAVSSTCGGAGKSLFIEYMAKTLQKSKIVSVLSPFSKINRFNITSKNQDLSDLVLEYNYTKQCSNNYTKQKDYCKYVFEPFNRFNDIEEIKPEDLFNSVTYYVKSKSINYLIYEVANRIIPIDKYFLSFAKHHFVIQDTRRSIINESNQERDNLFFIYNFSNRSQTFHLPDISLGEYEEDLYQEKIDILCRGIKCKRN